MNFLVKEWKKDTYANILKGHKLFVGHNTEGWLFEENDGHVQRSRVAGFDCEHEEADTRVLWHIVHIIEMKDQVQNVSVRATDTDILVLLLHYVGDMAVNVWMDTGCDKNNSRTFINVSALAADLGPDICRAPVGYHAFTGCDFTASFMGKGKVRPYQIMRKHPDILRAFGMFGEEAMVPEAIITAIETFVCYMYGQPKLSSVNKAREAIFKQKNAPQNNKSPFAKIKKFDACSLPLCKDALSEKIKRTNYVTSIWKRGNQRVAAIYDPEESGWNEVDGKYRMTWFSGSQMPQTIECALAEANVEDEEDESDDYDSQSDESLWSSDSDN